MASIDEMKAALETDQQRAAELAERALASIDTITNVGNFYLATIGLAIAVVAIIGGTAIFFGCRSWAHKIAERQINAYIKGDVMATVRAAISEEVRSQIEAKSFVVVHPQAAPDNGDAFPKDPKEKGG